MGANEELCASHEFFWVMESLINLISIKYLVKRFLYSQCLRLKLIFLFKLLGVTIYFNLFDL